MLLVFTFLWANNQAKALTLRTWDFQTKLVVKNETWLEWLDKTTKKDFIVNKPK